MRFSVLLSLCLMTLATGVVVSGVGDRTFPILSSQAIAQTVEERKVEGDRLFEQGERQYNVSQFREALQSWGAALQIYREIGDQWAEGATLGSLGLAYSGLGQYQRAIELYEQRLAVAREIGDRRGEGNALGNFGNAYVDLGQYQQAIELYEQRLAIAREIGDRRGEGNALGSLGNAYSGLGRYQRAIELYEQRLAIAREIGDRRGEGNALGNLGNAYRSLGQYQRSIELYEQVLVIVREIGDQRREGIALVNLGVAYAYLEQYQRAIESYQQVLEITQEIGARATEGITLSNIGRLLSLQNQPELAIIFLKRSVSVREAIRGDIRGLDRSLQQSYTDTVASNYRLLANLLLQQNRVLEAQRVLDLLKVQELDDYLRNIQRNGRTESGVSYWQPEQQILTLYAQVIAEANDLTQLEEKKNRTGALTSQEQQRYDELLARRGEIRRNFSQFAELQEVKTALAQLRNTTSGQNIELSQFNRLQNNLRDLQQNAVLLYPLILSDRLELVLVTPNAPPIRKPVNIKAVDLNRLIVQMGQALKDPESDIKPIAQQLYRYLIQPLESELAAANARTIVYAPDSALRYIPLSALHDGRQWLAERFAVTHITAASLNDFDDRPSYRAANGLRILAGACAECSFKFEVGGQSFNFSDLPYTRTEVENIATSIPGTETLLNRAFSPTSLVRDMRRFPILHLATHAAFVQGQGDQSFIVFGNNSKVSLSSIKDEWDLTNTDLVVLSACQTAIGEPEPGSGIEILGFGYQIQDAGAQAAIASLWQVSDGGTQVLMNAFYTALQNGKTKAEALQLAQQALITGNLSVVGQGQRATVVVRDVRTGLPPRVRDRLNHPYYWAPFILIGNGL
jgi:CHAT domain-containing protein